MDGELNITCNLHIDGNIKGTVGADKSVRIGSDGQVTGQLKAVDLTVAGKVEGTIEAKVVEILESGIVEGSIHCEELIIAKGGRFLGESKPLSQQAAKVTPIKEDKKAQG
ncbi:polymer-forming cytoskeletal protein [Gallaecimonas sp. GXIMD4217]|uniref:bactofilin family protein n=1 Tax=Gallaecimonas sp. GXIMD4217 TaxID=3131927 RepID=UPI00311AC2D8